MKTPILQTGGNAPPNRATPSDASSRRGAIAVLSAFIIVILFGFVAFSVDLGYISIVRSELQNAADGAALAGVDELGLPMSEIRDAAESVASANTTGNKVVDIDDDGGQIEQGWFDERTKDFSPRNRDVNAVRVQLRRRDMPLMFAPLIGTKAFDADAEAIAMVNPRDIVLVVDLSGSMNNDTETSWATELIDQRYAGTADDGIGTRMAQDLYDDLGFGTFPGPMEHVGENAFDWVRNRMKNNTERTQFDKDYRAIPDNYFEIGELTSNDSPLSHQRVPGKYRVQWNDKEDKRRDRVYRWMMDHQIARLMPAARPSPNSDSRASRDYWFAYLDYIMYRGYHTKNGSTTKHSFSRRKGSTASFYWPAKSTHRNLYQLGNPSSSSFPGASWSVLWKDLSTIGYRSYVNFMGDYGWNGSPHRGDSDLEDPKKSGKPQMSHLSPYCPKVKEAVNGEMFTFPPRTQPMHACRRSMIAALQTVRERNERLAESAADRVAIVTYDAVHKYSRPTVVHDLNNDFDTAMETSAELQACYDGRASTATENALILARNILKTKDEHKLGQGRAHANKIVVLLTDGMPNLYESSNAEIAKWRSDNPNSDYYGNWFAGDAPLMQANQMQREDIMLFGLSMGMGASEDFMGRLARLANTDVDGNPLTTAGDPSKYEEVLTKILKKIINNAGIRLVR